MGDDAKGATNNLDLDLDLDLVGFCVETEQQMLAGLRQRKRRWLP